MKYQLFKVRNIKTGVIKRMIRNLKTGEVVKEQDQPERYAKLRKMALLNSNRRAENSILRELCGTSARVARLDMGL